MSAAAALLRRPPRLAHLLQASCSRAASRRMRARRARAELQGGGGGDDEASNMKASAQDAATFIASLNSALLPLSEGLARLNDTVEALSAEFAEQRRAMGALSENVGALAEVVAGSAVASTEWSRARACSLSELCAVLLRHEEGCDESRAVVRKLCASFEPDVWRGLLAVVHKLHASLSELQRFGLKAEILCDDTLDLRQRLGGDRPDWACLQQLARLYEAKLLAAPQCADEARVAGALHRFAAKMDAAGTLSPATSEPAARLLEETDGRARRAGSSLAFAVATALLCDVPLFELDFDGIGQLSFCAATGVLAIPLMEVKTAPAKASDAAWQLRRRAAVVCAVCLAAARCEGSPWASLQRVVVDGSVPLLRPLRPQQMARLRVEHAHASLLVPSAGQVKCSAHVSFWVIGNPRDNT